MCLTVGDSNKAFEEITNFKMHPNVQNHSESLVFLQSFLFICPDFFLSVPLTCLGPFLDEPKYLSNYSVSLLLRTIKHWRQLMTLQAYDSCLLLALWILGNVHSVLLRAFFPTVHGHLLCWCTQWNLNNVPSFGPLETSSLWFIFSFILSMLLSSNVLRRIMMVAHELPHYFSLPAPSLSFIADS